METTVHADQFICFRRRPVEVTKEMNRAKAARFKGSPNTKPSCLHSVSIKCRHVSNG